MIPIREHMLSPRLHLSIHEAANTFNSIIWMLEIYDRKLEKKLMFVPFSNLEKAIDQFHRVIKDFNEKSI